MQPSGTDMFPVTFCDVLPVASPSPELLFAAKRSEVVFHMVSSAAVLGMSFDNHPLQLRVYCL